MRLAYFTTVLTIVMLACTTASATWYLVDDFSDTSLNTTLWSATEVAPTSSVSISSGRLHLNSPWYSSTSGHGAFVTLNETFNIGDSADTGVLSLAYDVEMGSSMTRSYGHVANVNTVSGDAARADVLFYGGGDKDIYLNNGSTYGSKWLEKNFQNQPLHIQATMTTSTISYKVFNFQSGNTPSDYTDTSADLNDLTAGSLIGTASLNSGIASTSEELYLLLAGTTATTSGGGGDIYFDNVYMSAEVPEPITMSLLTLGGIALLRRRK